MDDNIKKVAEVVKAATKERLRDDPELGKAKRAAGSAPEPKSPEIEDGPVGDGVPIKVDLDTIPGPEPDELNDQGSEQPAKRRKKRKRKSVRADPKPDLDDDEWIGGFTMDQVKEAAGQLVWSWRPFIPKGQVSMFVGPQGVGKSYLMAYLIAVFTGARVKWPDGKLYEGDIGPVILCETEGMRSEYVARMERLNIQPDMVIFPTYEDGGDFIDRASYVVDIAEDMRDVERLANKRGASAIIIDSLSGGHSYDETKDSMRGLLQTLSVTASRTQLPVIVVHHPRKAGSRESQKITIDRVRGSSTITQFCRSVVGVYRLTHDMTSPVRVETVKSSFSGPGQPFGYTITEVGLDFHEAPEIKREPTALDVASDFLLETLQDGPMPSAELKQLAADEGVTLDTLHRAKKRLGVIHEKDGKSTIWMLPTIDGTPYPTPKKHI